MPCPIRVLHPKEGNGSFGQDNQLLKLQSPRLLALIVVFVAKNSELD